MEMDRVRCVDEDNAYAVFVSYVQIYNNYVYDLLDPQGMTAPDKYVLDVLVDLQYNRVCFL